MNNFLLKLISALDKAGIGCDDRDLADMVWLAACLLHGQTVGRKTETDLRDLPQTGEVCDPLSVSLNQAGEDGVANIRRTDGLSGKPSTSISSVSVHLPRFDTHQPAGNTGSLVKVPLAPALPGKLSLARSLRPMMQQVHARTMWTFDEKETVRRIAEGDVWAPVVRPALEPRFRVSIIIDDSVTMGIWRRIAGELCQVVRGTGAFRFVNVYRLDADGQTASVYFEKGKSSSSTACRIESSRLERETVFLVVTDCISPAWQNGNAFRLLEKWSRFSFLCLVQVLPEPMWRGTALREHPKVRLRNNGSARRNADLETLTDEFGDRLVPAIRFRLPLATLEPAGLGALANLFAGMNRWSAGILPSVRSTDGLPAPTSQGNWSARQRVENFRETASPTAQRLAGLIAASPIISLQVIYLVCQSMLPEVGPTHQAEFVLGGLVYAVRGIDACSEEESNDRYFRFYDGVDDILLDATPSADWLEVLNRVSEFVEPRLGISQSFRALLADPSRRPENIEISEHPFVRVAVSRIARLGGAYAMMAKRLQTTSATFPAMPPSAMAKYIKNRARDLEGKRLNSSVSYSLTEPIEEQTLGRFKREKGTCFALVWGSDQRRALSGSGGKTLRLWDVETGRCLRVFEGHTGSVTSVAWSLEGRLALSGASDKTLRLWEVKTGRCLRVFEGHTDSVTIVALSSDGNLALSGADDKTVRVWEVNIGRCLRVFQGHTESVTIVAWSPDGQLALSGADDKTVWLWEVNTGRRLRVFEGHTDSVNSVAWSPDGQFALSGADDKTVRLWEVSSGRCLRVMEGHTDSVRSVFWSPDGQRVHSGAVNGVIHVWETGLGGLDEATPALESVAASTAGAAQVLYTNAKVLIVGESGVGKTGLSQRLALNNWKPSDSTVGAWATQWKLPVSTGDGVEREIWLWDFGGQADQRLIHQLYMDETALAVLVFDGQKEDLFETLGQWDRDLSRASRKAFTKLLVASRVDAGGLVSRSRIEAFAKERGYAQFIETSAKTNLGCEELRQAITEGIHWENIPWCSSPLFFKRLKEEIIWFKDGGRVLIRFNELRDALRQRLSGEDGQFKEEELKAVVGLLSGPGVVWELSFGGWVLLQPELINAYAQAVIQTLREDPHERGCIPEERVLAGHLAYHSSMQRLDGDEERLMLLAMHQILIERGLCLREHTGKGPMLIFPSYYRRERPELVGHPAVLVSYRFNGFLDDIYDTLVVRLHHTNSFRQDQLWRYAADFKTLTGKQLGVKLTRRAEGAGELDVYFDPGIPLEEKIIFIRYVHEHLLQKANDVERYRHYICPHCGTPAGNLVLAMKYLGEGKKDIPCINCDDPDKRIPLWDQLEALFASEAMKNRVRELQEQSAIVLDTESKERILVGEIISTVALAGQICREFTVSDHGIDMEIEFKDDNYEATGQRLYLQLKSGDSYLRERKRDGAEIFTIQKVRHARYWMAQKFPVLLVIRNSEGEVRWMEVRDWLKRASGIGNKLVKQIVFEGERFDVMSVRRWRERVLRL
ncbi:MAG: DUF4365 domain-containing protein [Deltaproteobacteria bacterium]|nr:DUF4365 domain-containing protein [Deltaproteobacteria bacterium]